MSIIDFVPQKTIKPLFGIKIVPILKNINEIVSEEEYEKILKKALGIDNNRMINIKEVEDEKGILEKIIIIFNYKSIVKAKSKIGDIINEKGYFDFPIYEIDYNKKINVEEIIKQK